MPAAGPAGASAASGQDPPGTFAGGRAQRLHASSPILTLVVHARQFVVPLVALLIGSARSVVLGPVALAVLALVVAWRVLDWRRFTYRLADGVLVLEQGILQRSRREIPVSRIQQVDLRRRLRHRVLGVAVVRIDTAGGGAGAEVTLEAIAESQALALRTALLGQAGGRAATADPWADGAAVLPATDPEGGAPGTTAGAVAPAGAASEAQEPVVVTHLSTRDLVVAGVTGSRLVTAVPLAGAALGLLAELPGSVADRLTDLLPTGAVALVGGLVLALPLLLAFAVASSVLTDHDFTLARIGRDLHLRRGLLDQREATISLHRVQLVRCHENPLRRALGLASVQLQSAGSGNQAEGAVSRVTIPSVRADRLEALLAEVLPTAVDRPSLVPAPPAARRRAWVRRVVPIVVATAVLVAVTGEPAALLLLLLLGPAGVDAELTYRNLGHVATPTLVVARGGGLVRETVLVPVAKAQSTRLETSVFQRRAGLATLHLQVAGRGEEPRITDGDAARLAALRHGALHAPAAQADEESVRRRLRTEAAAEDG